MIGGAAGGRRGSGTGTNRHRPARCSAVASLACVLVLGAAASVGAQAPGSAPVPMCRPPLEQSAPAAVGRWSATRMEQVSEGPGTVTVAPSGRRPQPVIPDAGPGLRAQAEPGAPVPLLSELEERRLPAARPNGGLRAGEVLVPVNKSQVLRVDRGFDEVSVGNPEAADVVPLTQRSIYVFGKQLGSTSLTLIGTDGEVIAVVDLVVTFDLKGLKGRLHELVPAADVEVRPAGDAIVLSGNVPSAGQLASVLAVRNASRRRRSPTCSR